jgi:hypothetical protein
MFVKVLKVIIAINVLSVLAWAWFGIYPTITFFVLCACYGAYRFVQWRKAQNAYMSEIEAKDDTIFNEYCATLNNIQMNNLIISGGLPSDRSIAVKKILSEAKNKKIPTIVLHSGFTPFGRFTQNVYYDPCIGADSEEIAEILTDTATNALNIDTVVYESIRFIVDILKAENDNVTLYDVVKFPYDDVMEYLDERVEKNSITSKQYDKFKQRYNNPSIKENIFRVAPLFAKLKTIAQKGETAQPISFRQAVVDKSILFFDLLDDTNAVLKEMVFSAICKAMELGKFWVVAEGISFMGRKDSKVDTVFTKNRNNISLIYSGEDVPVLTAQNDEDFKTFVGSNSQLLLFAHSSGGSALKWSEYFGKEFHKKTIETTSTGLSLSGGYKQSSSALSFNEGETTISEYVYKYPPEYFKHWGETTDIDGNPMMMGLGKGESYFICDNSGYPQMTRISLKKNQAQGDSRKIVVHDTTTTNEMLNHEQPLVGCWLCVCSTDPEWEQLNKQGIELVTKHLSDGTGMYYYTDEELMEGKIHGQHPFTWSGVGMGVAIVSYVDDNDTLKNYRFEYQISGQSLEQVFDDGTVMTSRKMSSATRGNIDG